MSEPTKTLHATHTLSVDGAVDADGHILEPPDLWERYLEPKYRDRALRFVLDDDGLEELEIGGKRSLMSRRGFPSTLGAMGDPDLRAMQKDPERTYLREAPFGSMDPRRAARAARRRGHRRGRALHHRRSALGGRARRPRAQPGLHARLQPVDLRVLCRQPPPRAHRAPLAVGSEGRGRRARARRRRGRQGRLRRAVHPRRAPARPSRQRPGLRHRPGARRAVRDPPHLRAAVDEGHAHGRVGERAGAAPPRIGHRLRRRPAPVHDPLRLRRVRPLPRSSR